jgi:lipid-A-disaccharide synthase-like uncharacterized protein
LERPPFLAFFSRFLIQWLVSERQHRSVVPMAFWYLSILGSIILLIYAIHRKDPIFTLAYTPNAVVYFRNIVLRRREEQQKAQDEAVEGP